MELTKAMTRSGGEGSNNIGMQKLPLTEVIIEGGENLNVEIKQLVVALKGATRKNICLGRNLILLLT